MNKIIDHYKRLLQRTMTAARSQALVLAKWLAMGLITGSIVGLLGGAFFYALKYANLWRKECPWLLFFMPVAGILIVLLYRFLKNTHDTGTNMVIKSIHSSTQISHRMTPSIFAATFLTHLTGGSVGREGAALQIGGSMANLMSDIPFLKFTEHDKRVNILCGMSAGFAALFGTPMAAAIFSLEVVAVGVMQYSALVPCILASFTARYISSLLGVPAELYAVAAIPAFTLRNMVMMVLIGICLGLVSLFFCHIMHVSEHVFKKYLKNPFVRIVFGGCLIILLRYLFGTDHYLGSGAGLIEHIFETGESFPWYGFLLKILFTAITIGSGYKGGEIVPSFCIGALFGSLMAPITGLPVSLAAACGMLGVFCGVTNCPITALLIGFEMFGMEGMPFFLIAIAVSYAMSGNASLYHTQLVSHSKVKMEYENSDAVKE